MHDKIIKIINLVILSDSEGSYVKLGIVQNDENK